MDYLIKIKDQTQKLAFELLEKNSKERTENDKLWFKLHGGSTKFNRKKSQIRDDLNWNKQFKGYSCVRRIDYQMFKPIDPNNVYAKKILDKFYDHLLGRKFDGLVEILEIIREVSLWDLKRKNYDYTKVEKVKKEILETKKFFMVDFPIPVKNIKKTVENLKIKRKEWLDWHEMRIIEELNHKEKLKLIKRYKLDSNVSYEEVKKIEASRKRQRLGIGEESNLELVNKLLGNIKNNLKNVEGFLYLKTWKIDGKTQWFKIGITNDLDRRDLEQNVLPIAAKTLATAKVPSMEHARNIEKSIHKVIENFKIKNANNRELFRLKPEDLASLLEVFKKIEMTKGADF